MPQGPAPIDPGSLLDGGPRVPILKRDCTTTMTILGGMQAGGFDSIATACASTEVQRIPVSCEQMCDLEVTTILVGPGPVSSLPS